MFQKFTGIIYFLNLFLVGCDSENLPILSLAEDAEIEYEVLHGDSNWGIGIGDQREKKIEILSSQAAYNERLAQYSAEVPVVVDFNENRVLLVDEGWRGDGGLSLRVSDVMQYSDAVLVTIVNSLPGNGCDVTLGLTNPFQIVRLKTHKPLFIQEVVEFGEDCDESLQ